MLRFVVITGLLIAGSAHAQSGDLSADQRGAISDHVRECWTNDTGAPDIDKMRVTLTVTVDANGVARKVVVGGDDVGRMGDPRFRSFADRTMQAVLDPRCNRLPLPATALGHINVLTFRFIPNSPATSHRRETSLPYGFPSRA
jgi:hypothetical protein